MYITMDQTPTFYTLLQISIEGHQSYDKNVLFIGIFSTLQNAKDKMEEHIENKADKRGERDCTYMIFEGRPDEFNVTTETNNIIAVEKRSSLDTVESRNRIEKELSEHRAVLAEKDKVLRQFVECIHQCHDYESIKERIDTTHIDDINEFYQDYLQLTTLPSGQLASKKIVKQYMKNIDLVSKYFGDTVLHPILNVYTDKGVSLKHKELYV